MTKVLIVNSSAQGDASVSNQLSQALADRLRRDDPALEIKARDVGSDPLPHLTAKTVGTIRGAEPDSDEARATLALADELVDEIRQADLLVIGSPMYNFGISSTLKAWFDHVLRAGITFRYTQDGPEGLMKGKKAVVIETRAGLYSEGDAQGLDSQEPHLRTMLSFMGIDDVIFVRAEKLAFGPDAAAAAIEAAADQLRSLSGEELALAA